MSATAYPLAWPDGWPRTRPDVRKDGNFKQGSRLYGDRVTSVTFDTARTKLLDELARLKAVSIVLSTNIPLRNDGQPRADSARSSMEDPGVAIYFTLNKRPMVMACDRFRHPADNCRSLGLAIEGMRQLERHGGGVMMERAFAGFAALPAPGMHHRSWREVLGLKPGEIATRDVIMQRYRALAAKAHPDQGGTDAAMAELNVARDLALKGEAA